MTPQEALGALEILYGVGVPVLFWVGLLAGVIVNASSSSPYFLGNSFFTRLYLGIVILYVVSLVHSVFRIPFFGSIALEYTLIAGVLGLLFGALNAADEASKRKMVADDPKSQLCPKCGVILDMIFRECPRCETPLEGEARGPESKKSS